MSLPSHSAPERGKSGAALDLWIECPHCEGAAGWYGCEDCAAVLSRDRDEPPTRRYCESCLRRHDCADDGGHRWGEVVRDERQGFVRICARCGDERRVWSARWEGSERRYVEVSR